MVLRAMGVRLNTAGVQLSSFTIFVLLLKIQGHCNLNSEGLALLAFRAAVELDPQGAFMDWNPDDCNPCMWSGVHCVDGRVEILNLNGLLLEGILAPELGKLTHLRILALSQNQFYGAIPKEFGGLAMLEIMDLRNNSLNGTVPTEIEGIPSLKCLLLHDNKFEGIVSPQNQNLDMPSEMQSDGSYVSGTAAEYGCLNRKLVHCISHCDILSLKKAEAFMKSESLLKAELFSTQIKEKLNRNHHILPSFKHEEEDSSENAEDGFDEYLTSAIEPQITNLVNTVRRRLAEESINLFAAPVGESSNGEPIISLPSTRSSGSFPAIPKEKKKASLSPAESPQVPHHAVGKAKNMEKEDGHSGDKWKYVVGVLVAIFVVIVATIMFYVCRTQAVKNIKPWKSGLSGQLQKAFVTGVPKLNLHELETACEDFSNIIETHESCTVYKGILTSGVEISVTSTTITSCKEWSKRSEIGYRKQIDSLSRINHKNFVNLIGFCEEDKPFARMMVFEFSPNGTLFEHLHLKELEHLDWNARVRIIMGTAYCLQYMHDLKPPLPHSKLKSDAIFLTEDYAAKIAEIGFWNELHCKSRVTSGNESGQSEFPPLPDVETDVYNFGILLLEIVSGRLPYSEEQGHLSNWASEYLNDSSKFDCMIDPILKSFKNDELEVICNVVQECIQKDPRKRPTIKEIITKLREVIRVSPDAATPRLSPLWWAELEILSAEAS
ncbi:Protein MALE DISCOVERER 2 like [Heracleum sosnowskyi]|uniref:Protein MALE DISCOVERER 2 like n=1 Tax=Heracleum sosnowskyi TaxID=360622 RepID=A0AAD8MQY3_9APIA|nr:Protein MALE DISCOVERER 2 like [Heracleum sosnowskyi]